MRLVIACLAAIGLLAGSAAVAVPAAAADSTYVVALAQQPPSGELNVDVDLSEGGGAWYADPVWIGIGAVALIVLVLIVAMASRGGTTVIRE